MLCCSACPCTTTDCFFLYSLFDGNGMSFGLNLDVRWIFSKFILMDFQKTCRKIYIYHELCRCVFKWLAAKFRESIQITCRKIHGVVMSCHKIHFVDFLPNFHLRSSGLIWGLGGQIKIFFPNWLFHVIFSK